MSEKKLKVSKYAAARVTGKAYTVNGATVRAASNTREPSKRGGRK